MGKNEKKRALSAQQIAEHAANLQSRGFTVVAEPVVDAPLSKPSSTSSLMHQLYIHYVYVYTLYVYIIYNM